jgi:SET domain-containing protein
MCFSPLGLAMIYNHSSEPNAEWEIHDNNNFVRFVALKDISKGEEIFHDYGEEYWESRDGESNSQEEDKKSCEGLEESFQITRKAS